MHEQTIELEQAPVFYRRAAGAGAGADAGSGADTDAAALLYLHSVPTSSDDWVELLELTGGVAPDLPGFGRSGKGGNLDYSLDGYVAFLERFLDAVSLEQVTIVGHGWGGAIGLCLAQRHPERVRRMALINAVPLLEGFEWPAIARWWRRPVAGEFLMGSITRRLLGRGLRSGCARREAWPEARINDVWEQFDQGTQRAILRLHRSVDAAGLAAAGSGLGELRQPALVVWGERDPWLPASFADAYARRLGAATVERVPEAGYWPWLDRPELVQRLAAWATEPQPT